MTDDIRAATIVEGLYNALAAALRGPLAGVPCAHHEFISALLSIATSGASSPSAAARILLIGAKAFVPSRAEALRIMLEVWPEDEVSS